MANYVLPRAVVLMYHRVAEIKVDPWDLSVSPTHFREHVDYLQSRGDVWPLVDYARALRQGALPKQAIVITFDDGYADNVETAAPILEEAGLPATFFITTGGIGQAGEFWWDDVERCILHKRPLPCARIAELMNAMGKSVASGERESLVPISSSHTDGESPQRRKKLYDRLWKCAYDLGPQARSHFIAKLREVTNTPLIARSTHRTLTVDELVQLSRVSGIDIGAHAVTHTPLTKLDASGQHNEIVESCRWLETNIGGSVETFSYPNGAFESEAVALLKKEGIIAACTTEATSVRSSSHPLMIPRIQVRDVDADVLQRMINRFLV